MQPFDVETFLRMALAEDVGAGDITSRTVIPPAATARFAFRTRQNIVGAGLDLIPMLFALVDADVRVALHAKDGQPVAGGGTLATLEGNACSLLAGERLALNLLQHLSGIATLTSQYVAAIAGTSAVIVNTRKTLPGLRTLQKAAVRAGGGVNHRMGLYDGILIKDNHLVLAGGIAKAVAAAKAASTLPVQVECDTLAQLDEAIMAGAHAVLLDNMDMLTLREAVARAKKVAIVTEASGNVNLHTVRAIAETGVDRISIGRLTHSAPAVDIGLDTD